MRALAVALAFAIVAPVAGAAAKRQEWTAAEKRVFRQVDAATKEAVKRPHPRLFANAGEFARIRAEIATNALHAAAWVGVESAAAALIGEPPTEREIVGPRMLGTAHRVFSRLQALAMAYRLSGERKYLERAEEEMLNACAYEDWNPKHFLDTATMCLGLGVAYDWLYDDLEPTKRERILKGMMELGFAACEAGGSWQRRVSNWGQVCNAGAIAVALATIDSDRPRAVQLLTRSISGIQPSMGVYAPHGAYPEGPNYWSYGTSYNAYAIAMLESALGSDFGLCALPGFAETCSFLEMATGPSGRTLNYSDGGDGRGIDETVWWFAKRFSRPDLLAAFEGPRYLRFAKGGRVNVSPFMLFWLRDVPKDAKVELPLAWNSEGPNPFAVHRSGWDGEAMFAAIKAGRPSYPHGHQDSGSFWLDAGGVRWVCDLGANDYHRAEVEMKELWNTKPESKRWKIFRLGVGGHSTLSFDGRDQDVYGESKVVSVTAGPESEVVVDLSANYPMAKSVRRTGRILPGGKRYRLTDQIAGARAGSVVRWQFVTRAEVSEVDGDIQLAIGERRMIVRKRTKEESSGWKILRNPRNADWEDPNEGVSVVSFTTTVPKGGALKIAVGFVLTK